jgi:hypothetical protein
MQQHTPLYIVSSPRPRTGKTLIARLLIEFLLANDRHALGYDLNPSEPRFAAHFADIVGVADISDTLGQMALFDRLCAESSPTTVIDLGCGLFSKFFAVMEEIGFEQEAQRQLIDPIVLFIADSAPATARCYCELRRHLPHTAFVPVHNEGISLIVSNNDFPPTRAEHGVIRIPRLSPIVRRVIDRPKFSFGRYMARQPGGPTEVHDWIDGIFLEFRTLELRLLMTRVTSALEGIPARPGESRTIRDGA